MSKETPKFTIGIVDKKPERRYKKGNSKYFPVIEAFKEATKEKPYASVNVSMGDMEPNYLRTQLKKVIDKLDGDDREIIVSVINGSVYLEREEPKTVKKL